MAGGNKDRLKEGDIHIGYGVKNGPFQIRGSVTNGVMVEGETTTEFQYNGPPSLLEALLRFVKSFAASQGKEVHSNNADRS